MSAPTFGFGFYPGVGESRVRTARDAFLGGEGKYPVGNVYLGGKDALGFIVLIAA